MGTGRVPSLDTRGSFDPSSPMIASYAEYPPGDNIAESEVSIIRRIGEGAYGEVSLAMCKTFGKVAIKWLKVTHTTIGSHGLLVYSLKTK